MFRKHTSIFHIAYLDVDELSDNDLVGLVLKGQTDAYRVIVERHQERMFYLGLKFLRTPENAEDFAQEVLVRAYERLRSFSGRVPFSAWLYRIGVNLAINKYHVRKREMGTVDVSDIEIADERGTPESSVVEAELTGALRQKLRELPRMYQLVIKMHFFDGFPYKGISRMLEIPVNTLKSYVHRAKEMLKNKLGPYVDGV